MPTKLVSVDVGRQGDREKSVDQIVKALQEDGCVKLRHAFSPELIRRLADALTTIRSSTTNEQVGFEVGKRRQQHSIEVDTVFAAPEFSANRPVVAAIRKLIGSNVVISGLSVVISEPGAPDQNCHRDHPWLFETPIDRLLPAYGIKLAVPMIAISGDNGVTRVWPKSHRHYDDDIEKLICAEPELEIGDAMMMDYRIYHQGLANQSDDERPILFMRYVRPWFKDVVNQSVNEPITVTAEAARAMNDQQKSLFRLALCDSKFR